MQRSIDDFVPEDRALSSLESAIAMVREAGYVVLPKSSLDPLNVTSASKLVDFFYNYLQYTNPHRKIHYSLSITKDIAVAKRLIKKRVCSGVSRRRAANEAAHIVKCVIDNERLFGFNEPLSSFQVFMGGKFEWVIQKAITIINGEDLLEQEERLRKFDVEREKKYMDQMTSVVAEKGMELDLLLKGVRNAEEK